MYLEEDQGHRPFYASRSEMDLETHEVYLYCVGLIADRRARAAAQAARDAEAQEAPPEESEVFDLAAYGPLAV